jgi:NDP-sugar pyrophosphorylase family protein/aminoglycoside/choline kinase family phosphotransferase
MPKHPLNIFLPAAGLGERLRPITNHLPKPLLPVLGRPLIEIILERLTAVCSGRIGINLHYKPDMIRAWARGSAYADRIEFFPESTILGTGGALKNAGAFLSKGPFLVHNSDILLNIDFSRLIETHLSSGNIATLATHDLPKFNNVVVDEKGALIDVENPGTSTPDPKTAGEKVAYTGIAVYSPEILRFLPPGVSHATVAWVAAAAARQKVQTLDFTDCSWNDIGTPATYAAGILDALRESGETIYLSSSATCGDFESDGYMVVEAKSEISGGGRLRNCIVLPGARVSGTHKNGILGPDYSIELSESEMQPTLHAAEQKRVSLSEPLFARYFDKASSATDVSNNSALRTPHSALWADAILIGLGGSDRRYFRVRNRSRSAVLMECRPEDPDYERHLVYTRFFAAHTVPVPKLISTDEARKAALFEDLGDTSLYSYMKLPRSNGHIGDIYRRVLDILVKLHAKATENIQECPLLQARIFDYDYLRWETGYFLERFVLGLKKIPLSNTQPLDDEFHRLAQNVDSFPKAVIHRDFQCQNIMITHGSVPRVIDFQGARMAPAAYDIASILWDPYHRLDDSVREGLIEYYVREMKMAYHKGAQKNPSPRSSPRRGEEARDSLSPRRKEGRGEGASQSAFDEKTFFDSLILCRLQRHMQALGAYGFLSEVKGKKYFLKHIPEALRLLREETTLTKNEYPVLYRLVQNLG